MMNKKRTRGLAILLALLLCFSAVSFSYVVAEETPAIEESPKQEEAPKKEDPPEPEEAPKQEETPKQEDVSEQEPIQDAPSQSEPEATQPPQADQPAEDNVVEATMVPDELPTDLPEETLSPEETLNPEETLSPEVTAVPENPEQGVLPEESQVPLDPDVSAEPAPSSASEDVSGFEMRSRSKTWSDLHLNPVELRIPSEGMPIPILYQYDYKKTVCSVEGDSKSVSSSGCGAAAASMLISYIKQDYDQTPYTLFYWAADNGWYRGDGLNYDAIRSILANYGIDTREMAVSSDGIISALRKNQPIIIHMSPGTFTDSGHYIVLRGLDEDGKVLVNDPNSSSRSQRSYSAELISRECKSSYMLVAYTRPVGVSETEEPKQNGVLKTEKTTEEPVTSLIGTPASEEEPSVEEVSETEDGVFEESYLAVVNRGSVNLRDLPGTDKTKSLVVTSVKEGTILCVVDEAPDEEGCVWCAVEYQGRTLYIRGDMVSADGVSMTMEEYLAQESAIEPGSVAEPESVAEPVAAEMSAPEMPSETEDAVFEGSYLAAVNRESVNLGDLPGTDKTKSLVVTSVKEGTTLCVVDEVMDEEGCAWCAVLYQKQKLYIRGDMLTVLN